MQDLSQLVKPTIIIMPMDSIIITITIAAMITTSFIITSIVPIVILTLPLSI